MVKRKQSGSVLGSALGLLVFLGGIALLLVTFKLAYDMFAVPPQDALNVKPKQALDLPMAGQSLAVIFIRILLLVVMGIVGSLVANRGISLFAGSRGYNGATRDVSAVDSGD